MSVTGKPAQIIDALLARLQALTLDPELPVAWPEVAFAPETDAPDGKYLAVSFFPNRPAWEGIASGKVDQGLLQVSVVWPKGEGQIAPLQVAASVMAQFAKGLELVSGATKVKVYGEPWAAPPIVEADKVSVPITIPWKA
jgi:hypothetical protein